MYEKAKAHYFRGIKPMTYYFIYHVYLILNKYTDVEEML